MKTKLLQILTADAAAKGEDEEKAYRRLRRLNISELSRLYKERPVQEQETTETDMTKRERIIRDLNRVRGLMGEPPTVIDHEGEAIQVSAEDGRYLADYYQEYLQERRDLLTGKIEHAFGIHTQLHEVAEKHDMHWEWENPGVIGLYA